MQLKRAAEDTVSRRLGLGDVLDLDLDHDLDMKQGQEHDSVSR